MALYLQLHYKRHTIEQKLIFRNWIGDFLFLLSKLLPNSGGDKMISGEVFSCPHHLPPNNKGGSTDGSKSAGKTKWIRHLVDFH
jgi:hypothetical protein